MSIEIHAPDGSVVVFPDGTAADTIHSAMQKHFGDASGVQAAAVPSGAQAIRERYKDIIRKGGDEQGNYPGTQAPVPGFTSSLQGAMADPLGIRDELTGGGMYAGRIIGDLAHGRSPDWQAANDAYTDAAERVRAEKDIARERLGSVGNVAAGLVGGFGTIRAVPAAVAAARLPFWQRVRQASTAGAGFGAASGAGNAEGEIGDRLKGAAYGAGEGAVLGPALSEGVVPAALAAKNALVNSPSTIGNAVRTVVPGMRDNIDARLLTKLGQQDMTPADLRTQMTTDRADATFPGGTPMEIPTTLADSGPAMRNLAYSVRTQPGEGQTQAINLVEGRQRGTGDVGAEFGSHYDRMAEATRRALQVTNDNAARTRAGLSDAQSTASNAAYDAFRNSGVTIPVDDILQAHAAETAQNLTTGSKLFADIDDAYAPFSDEPHALGAVQGPSRTQEARHNLAQMQLDQHIAKAQEGGNGELVAQLQNLKSGLADQHAALTKDVNLTGPAAELTPAKFDNAKRQLYDMYKEADRKGENYKGSLLKDLHNRLVARADEATTVQGATGQPVSLYRNAREAYSTPQRQLDALEAGREFKGGDPDELRGVYGDLGSAAERRAFRGGVASDIIHGWGERGTGDNLTKAIQTPNAQTRLQALATGPNLDRLNAIAEQENRMAQTRQRLQGGSRTDENQQLRTDFTLAQRLGNQLRGGNILGAAGDFAASMLQKMYRYRETDARLLARDLFATDPAVREATVQRLEAAHGRIAARNLVTDAIRNARSQAGIALTGPVVGNLRTGSQQNQGPRNALLSR